MATLVKMNWLAAVLNKSIGRRPIAEITPHEMLSVLEKHEGEGNYEKARRLRSFGSRVFRFGVATLRCEHDPCSPLQGALISPKAKHYAAITDPDELGGLLRAIDRYEGNFTTKFALQFAPHVFVRPGELRHAEWDEFDSDAAVWRIPVREVIAVDLPGHGQTREEADSGTFEGLARSLEDWLGAENLTGIDMVGSSLGARLVLEMARRGQAGAIVALDPGGFWHGWERTFFKATITPSVALVRALRPVLSTAAGGSRDQGLP